MTNLRTALVLSALSIAAAACGTSSAAPAAMACDDKVVIDMAKEIDLANGIGVDLQDKRVEKARAEAQARITGKKYAFTGCELRVLAGTQLSFGAPGPGRRDREKYLVCRMKDREAGVNAVRDAAMKLDLEKLRLDVRGTITLHGDKGFERLSFDDCTIDVHE